MSVSYLESADQRAVQKVLHHLAHLPCQTWTILPKQILHVIHQEAFRIQFLLPQSVLATLQKIRIIRFCSKFSYGTGTYASIQNCIIAIGKHFKFVCFSWECAEWKGGGGVFEGTTLCMGSNKPYIANMDSQHKIPWPELVMQLE